LSKQDLPQVGGGFQLKGKRGEEMPREYTISCKKKEIELETVMVSWPVAC
jgi:hypothetical protein